MYRENTNNRLTCAEVTRRLLAIKRMLSTKSQVLYFKSDVLDRLDIDLTDVDSFYTCPIAFNKAEFYRHIADNKRLFDRDNFIHTDTLDYVSRRKRTLCKSFAVTAMLFTKYRNHSIVHKHVIVCIGSIYHAPRLFYKDIASNNIVYEKCSEYVDLM